MKSLAFTCTLMQTLVAAPSPVNPPRVSLSVSGQDRHDSLSSGLRKRSSVACSTPEAEAIAMSSNKHPVIPAVLVGLLL